MALRKCCVGNCPSTNRTHRLFFFPKDDNLRQLWLSFVIPTNVELSGLRKQQLVEKCVCQNHFDRHQFDSMGNRLRNGYPCLFSAKEIAYGIPLSSTRISEPMETETNRKEVQPPMLAEVTVGDCLSDHTYFLPNAHERDIEAVTIGVGDSPKTTEECTEKLVKKPTTKKIARQMKSFSKCTYFIKKMKKQSLAVHKQSFRERLDKAEVLSHDHSFLHNFEKLNKHTQNFLKMQLKSINKNKKGVRFTDDEKLLALTLMKESPKGYRLLQKIFKLPSKRTLNRLAEKITFGVGINENIFRLIERRCVSWNINKKICSIVFDEVE